MVPTKLQVFQLNLMKFKIERLFSGPAAYMLPRSSVSKPQTPAYTMRPKPNVGSFTEDLAKVN